ncbi:Hepatocyte growth factor-regulated tyrosine kinase substrate [Trichinella nelsoni]|uniref:Metalloendopeptidase n=1 Tax=Trichinella nelsoni TaxID=6336 RepID=A0A0V0S503_9BILA|nr:Hepatocyte growth factor-regulated tyrosine kinase substrate [Trichinella nelsoni]
MKLLTSTGKLTKEDGTFLTIEDFRNAMYLTTEEMYGSETHPPWQQVDKFQGDIVGKAVMRRRLKTRGVSRNGVRMTKDKWPNNEVPYVLSDYYTTKERAIIARAMKAYHDRTCVRFVPRTFEPDYLYIGKIDGCFSDVGRGGGRQELSLDFGCIDYETVIHELMHAVGFWHEHERWDRDNYIQILWNNVDRGGYDQFGKANLLESDYYDENYDYFSILHYDSKAFSRNGRNTIEARMPGMTAIIGRMKDFSPVDLRKINKMYNCSSYYTYAAGNPGVWLNHLPGATSDAFLSKEKTDPYSYFTKPNPFLPSPSAHQNAEICEDKATQCWLILDRCRSLFYEFLMRYLCPKSCGFCAYIISLSSTSPSMYGEEYQETLCYKINLPFLTPQDFKNGLKLAARDLLVNGLKSIWQLSETESSDIFVVVADKYRGDVRGKALRRRQFDSNSNLRGVSRNARIGSQYKWPDAASERAVIARAMQAYHEKTCIKFVARTHEPDYLYIKKEDGCFSDVGRTGGRQTVSLDDGCIYYRTIIHELMHAIGFWHEHERPDRDDFVDVIWYNIRAGAHSQFQKVSPSESNTFGERYDYRSIMHYDSKSFSKNGRDTMVAREPGMTSVMGKSDDFSPSDLRRLNTLYNCHSRPNSRPAPPPSPIIRPLVRPPVIDDEDDDYDGAPFSIRPPPPRPIRLNLKIPFLDLICTDMWKDCYKWAAMCRTSVLEFYRFERAEKLFSHGAAKLPSNQSCENPHTRPRVCRGKKVQFEDGCCKSWLFTCAMRYGRDNNLLRRPTAEQGQFVLVWANIRADRDVVAIKRPFGEHENKTQSYFKQQPLTDPLNDNVPQSWNMLWPAMRSDHFYATQPLSFIHPTCGPAVSICSGVQYTASVVTGIPPEKKALKIHPLPIKAKNIYNPNVPVTYAFFNGTPETFSKYFAINAQNAEIVQLKIIPNKEAGPFLIYVIARTAYTGSKVSFAQLNIQALNPTESRFEPEVQVTNTQAYIDENASIGTLIRTERRQNGPPLQISVTDKDLKPGMPPAIYQYILSGSGANHFAIDQRGYVFLNALALKVDKNGDNVHELIIRAREVDTTPIRTSEPVKVRIEIIALDSHSPPVFGSKVYYATAYSGLPQQSLIRVKATVKDSKTLAILKYRILSVSKGAEDLFHYNEDTNTLIALGFLNPNAQYRVVLEVMDKFSRTATTTIMVRVVDAATIGHLYQYSTQSVQPIAWTTTTTTTATIPATQPVIAATFNITVSEEVSPDTLVMTLTAEGAAPDQTSYRITDATEKGKFRIDKNDGRIFTAGVLDREHIPSHRLVIEVKSGTMTTYAEILVNISDVNDNPPKIVNETPIKFTVNSNSQNSIIGKITATDNDIGDNGIVRYRLKFPNKFFSIDPMKGIIKSRADLSTTGHSVHKLTIIAEDGGEPSLQSSVDATIEILNDNTDTGPFSVPVFTGNYSVGIDENLGPTNLVQIKAKYLDGRQGPVTYILRRGDMSLFSIDQRTGMLSTLVSLDAEKQKKYTLIVGTEENLSEQPPAWARVTVIVHELNDNSPIFQEKSYSTTISEAMPPGSSILQVSASDRDDSSPNNLIKYRLIGDEEAAKFFAIDEDSGLITIARSLLGAGKDKFTLSVEAKDKGNPPRSSFTTVAVHVEISTTTPLHFGSLSTWIPPSSSAVHLQNNFVSSVFNTTVYELVPSPHFVMTLPMKSSNPTWQPVVQCKILDGDSEEAFIIKTGSGGLCELETRLKLDREEVSMYKLNISAATVLPSGAQYFDYATVFIEVLDQNDNRPEFQFDEDSALLGTFIGIVDEKAAEFTPILKIKAVDKDVGRNKQIAYSLLENDPDSSLFMIDQETGELKTKAKLKEQRGKSAAVYRFRVQAKDNPSYGIPLSAEANVVVNTVRNTNRFMITVDKWHAGQQDQYVKKLKNVNLIFVAVNIQTKRVCRSSDLGEIFAKENIRRLKERLAPALLVQNVQEMVSPSTLLFGRRLQMSEIVLISVGCFIGLACLVGVLDPTDTDSKSQAKRASSEKAMLYAGIPPFNPILMSPSEKEYETQMLELSVPDEPYDKRFNLTTVGIDDGIYTIRPGDRSALYGTRSSSLSHVYIPPPDYPRNEDIYPRRPKQLYKFHLQKGRTTSVLLFAAFGTFAMSKKFEKLLDRATDATLLEADWESIMNCVDAVRSGETAPKSAILSVRKRYHSDNPHVAHHALLVLEALVKNGGPKIHREIATKEFMEDLKHVTSESADKVKDKVLELIQCWAHAFRDNPEYKIVKDTHTLMKLEGHVFPVLRESDAMFMAESAPDWVDADHCFRCKVQFSLITRKHHCRNCGQIFCDKCSNKNIPLPHLGIERDVRVCEGCFDRIKNPIGDLIKKLGEFTPSSVESSKAALEKEKQKEKEKKEAELREEEELQLALALSQSEKEEKDRLKNRNSYQWKTSSPTMMNSNYGTSSASVANNSPNHNEGKKDKGLSSAKDMENELARYLNRQYWEKVRLEQKQSNTRKSPTPSAPFEPTSVIKQPLELVESENNNNNGVEMDALQDFVNSLNESISVFVNRIKSNQTRGRSVTADDTIQNNFIALTSMHSRLLKNMQERIDRREYYENLQDKVNQIREAREALESLREEYRDKKKVELAEMQRQQQLIMLAKLQSMRLKKYEMLGLQRMEALRQIEEKQRELFMRNKTVMQQPPPPPSQQPQQQQQQQPVIPVGLPPQQQQHHHHHQQQPSLLTGAMGSNTLVQPSAAFNHSCTTALQSGHVQAEFSQTPQVVSVPHVALMYPYTVPTNENCAPSSQVLMPNPYSVNQPSMVPQQAAYHSPYCPVDPSYGPSYMHAPSAYHHSPSYAVAGQMDMQSYVYPPAGAGHFPAPHAYTVSQGIPGMVMHPQPTQQVMPTAGQPNVSTPVTQASASTQSEPVEAELISFD